MGIRLIKISIVYLVISTVLAMYMSITEIMTLSTVHSHISCLGWAMLALSGIFYHLFPDLEKKILSKIYFWAINIGLPIMTVGLAIYLYEQAVWAKVVISIGAIPTSVGIILFAINILAGVKKQNS